MILHISINDKDIREYGLSALDGTLNALMKCCDYKSMVKNENSAMDGTMYLTSPTLRKVKEQSFTIPFLMDASSIVDATREVENIESFLIQGANNSGVNKFYIYELNKTYYFVLEKISSYSNFGIKGTALVNIKFIEPNPKNRE